MDYYKNLNYTFDTGYDHQTWSTPSAVVGPAQLPAKLLNPLTTLKAKTIEIDGHITTGSHCISFRLYLNNSF